MRLCERLGGIVKIGAGVFGNVFQMHIVEAAALRNPAHRHASDIAELKMCDGRIQTEVLDCFGHLRAKVLPDDGPSKILEAERQEAGELWKDDWQLGVAKNPGVAMVVRIPNEVSPDNEGTNEGCECRTGLKKLAKSCKTLQRFSGHPISPFIVYLNALKETRTDQGVEVLADETTG